MIRYLSLALLTLLVICACSSQREGGRPDESRRPGESSEERRERLEREWQEYYGTTADGTSQPVAAAENSGGFIGNGLFVNLALIVGFYVLTRMTDFLFPGSPGSARRSLVTLGMAGLTLIITVLALVDIMV